MAEEKIVTGKKKQGRLTCVNCGQVQTEFWHDNGNGYLTGGKLYCCPGCAENSCTCIIAGGGG